MGVRIGDDPQPVGQVARVWSRLGWPVIQEDRVIVLKQPAAPPAIAFRPQSQGSEIRHLAHRSPGVRVLTVIDRFGAELVNEVDELDPVRREIGAALVDATVEPRATFKNVSLRVPRDHLNPLRRPATEYHRTWRFASD